MALKNDILHSLLNSGDYISGEALARQLGKSRAAVWKSIKALEKDGYEIDAVTNKGYKIMNKNTPLCAESIKSYLENEIDVICLASTDSTNNVCKRLLADGKQGVFLVAADEQTAGRGRQGKSFYSPNSSGVYFSLVIRPQSKISCAVTVTTAACVAVCRAIEELTDKKPRIKWVNDVFVDGKKVCGILTEAITNFEEGIVDSVIIGIGINISTEDFPDDVVGAGCLNAELNRNELIASIANKLMYIGVGDYTSFIDYYRSHSLIIGKRIKLIRNGKTLYATALAIDEKGGLEVKLDSGEVTVLRSGEISIRNA